MKNHKHPKHKNMKYKIKKASITDKNEVLVQLECSSDKIDTFEMSIIIPPGTSIGDTLKKINDAAFSAISDIIADTERKEARVAKDKSEKDASKALKKLIDDKIGKPTEIGREDKP